jgi:hypothetical protein
MVLAVEGGMKLRAVLEIDRPELLVCAMARQRLRFLKPQL